jgi:hypothetical protein
MSKYLPLWALGGGGVEITLSLASADAAMITKPTIPTTGVEGVGSSTYHLENIRCEVDMITIDSALQEQYSRNMLEGGSLTLHTNLWNVTQVFLGGSNAGSFDVSVSKSLSRVATLFANFSEELSTLQREKGSLYVNNFKAPGNAESMSSHVTVGSKRFPEFENQSLVAHFWRLTNALGVAKSLPHTLSTDMDSYGSASFCLGTDLEACPLVASSGINTTGGQEMALHCKNFIGTSTTGDAAAQAQANTLRRCWMMLHYEAIIELRATGCHLLT